MKKKQILIVEDEIIIARDIAHNIYKFGFDVCGNVTTGEEAIEFVSKIKPDLILMDIVLSGEKNGIEAAKYIYQNYDIPIIFVTSYSEEKIILDAISTNPFGYIIKPFKEKDLYVNIKIALHKHAQEKENRLKYKQTVKNFQEIKKSHSLVSKELERLIQKDVIGKSKKIEQVLRSAMTAAKHENTNILITGESGTGKEIVARIIHHASKRKANYFCIVNSSAIPTSLIESEFFGHVKGAFTGAISNKKGYLELADKGTLFLDEIADMPINIQAKLLRVIEEKKITKVGGNKQLLVDFRIISATNKDIYKLVNENEFRMDLLYRLNAMTINIPPLRERPEDIEPLVKYYLKKFSYEMKKTEPSIAPEVIKKLSNYHFPGNVRELKNLVENAFIHCDSKVLKLEYFPLFENIKHHDLKEKKFSENLDLEKKEIKMIKRALELSNFNQTQAAKKLNISRDSLIRRLKKYRITSKKILI